MHNDEGHFIGNNKDIFTDVHRVVIVKLDTPPINENGKVATYSKVMSLVRVDNNTNEDIETLYTESMPMYGMNKAQLIATFTAQKADPDTALIPGKAEELDSMITTLKNEA